MQDDNIYLKLMEYEKQRQRDLEMCRNEERMRRDLVEMARFYARNMGQFNPMDMEEQKTPVKKPNKKLLLLEVKR